MKPFMRRLVIAIAAAAIAAVAAASPLRTATSSAVPAEMRASFDEKMSIIESIVAAIENGPDAAGLTVANIVWLREALYSLPLPKLRTIGMPATLAQAEEQIANAQHASAMIGSSSSELVYYPMTPCRYVDTRVVGGPLSGTRSFDLSLTGAAYGGSLSCDPRQIVGGDQDKLGALAINVTIVSPTSPLGFIGVRPFGDSSTTSLVNWYEQGPSVQAANAGVVSINQQAGVPEIEFFGSPVQFIVDIFGVFAAPSGTALGCESPAPSQSVVASAASPNYSVAAPACAAGYTSISVNCKVAGDFTDGRVKQAQAGSKVAANCSGHYNGSSTATITAERLCCRLPGR